MSRRLIICELVRRVAIAVAFGTGLLAVTQSAAAAAPDTLIALAAAKFPNLTHAERAMLAFAEAGNVERGQFAVAGTSVNRDDPSNDPQGAAEWSKDREIRALLIRWLCEDPSATQLVSPSGIQVLGARIAGDLTLDAVQPPFAISLTKCSIPGRISLVGAHLRWLILSGSYTGQIYAPVFVADLGVFLDGVHSSGELYMDGAKIDGFLILTDAHFRHGRQALVPGLGASWNLAVRIGYPSIRGAIDLSLGFEADGEVEIDNCSIGGDFILFGSRFINPDKSRSQPRLTSSEAR